MTARRPAWDNARMAKGRKMHGSQPPRVADYDALMAFLGRLFKRMEEKGYRRGKRGQSWRTLSQEIGRADGYIHDLAQVYYDGHIPDGWPKIDAIEALAAQLDTSVQYLLYGEPELSPHSTLKVNESLTNSEPIVPSAGAATAEETSMLTRLWDKMDDRMTRLEERVRQLELLLAQTEKEPFPSRARRRG